VKLAAAVPSSPPRRVVSPLLSPALPATVGSLVMPSVAPVSADKAAVTNGAVVSSVKLRSMLLVLPALSLAVRCSVWSLQSTPRRQG